MNSDGELRLAELRGAGRAPATESMTLRDHFAAHAMQALVEHDDRVADFLMKTGGGDSVSLSVFIARLAYAHADSMLQERAK